MLVAALILLVVLALAVGAALAVVLARRTRRLRAAEDAVVLLARSWSEDGSSRGRLCAAAQQVADAKLAFLAEPTRRGDELTITATAEASDIAGLSLPIDPEGSVIARCFHERRPIDLRDLAEAPEISQDVFARVGARAGHLRPIFRGDHVVGVLVLAWSRTDLELRDAQAELVSALAGEAARAIERDTHVALLNRQARTDELTALPNRRAWDEGVQREIARARRTGEPLCVALLDLDHFKPTTTRTATPPATRTCAAPPPPGGGSCARSTCSPATAARSSACCCPAATPSAPARSSIASASRRRTARPPRPASCSTTARRAPSRCSPAPTPPCTAPSTRAGPSPCPA